MRMSTISKQSRAAQHRLADAVGLELRERRLALGLSQAGLGAPLTRAFVSSVERGRIVPSLPALLLMTQRLGADLGEFFGAVNNHMTLLYTAPHDRTQDPSPRRRR
jgi:transcriptional regulator with XRE-family HTH domain